MAIKKWYPVGQFDPFREMRVLQDRISRMFDPGMGALSTIEGENMSDGWFPPVDIREDGGNIYLTTEIPGVKKEELTVSLDGNILTITGEKKQESEIKKENYHRMERFFGSFSRSFQLPATVDASKISANTKDGVLTLTLPKKEEVKPKKIEVKVS